MLWVALLAVQPQAADVVSKLEGQYEHAGGPADQSRRDAAIDRTVDEMSWIASGIARRRLAASNQIPKRLEISRAGDAITIAFDGRERVTAIGALPVKVIGVTGSELMYTLAAREGTLVQRFENDGSGQVNAIRMDGEDVIVRVTVFSRRLPSNVVYELRYRRTKR